MAGRQVSIPVVTYVQALLALASGGLAQSASLTLTVALTQGWEIRVPVQFSHVGSISADPIVNVYRSFDGGVNYESQPFQQVALWRVTGGGSRTSVLALPTGQYYLQLTNAGPHSACFGVLTQEVITALQHLSAA